MSQPEPFGARPFQLVKLISWSFFVLILGSNLVLSIFLANYARETLLEKQKQYARLLAQNINHQVFQRFTMPTLIGFGQIELSNQGQYDHLDKVVHSAIHGFSILSLRIYDFEEAVAYALDPAMVGATGLAGKSVKEALDQGTQHFEIVTRYPAWRALLRLEQDPRSVVLKTVYAMRADRRLGKDEDGVGPIMGVLEFSQDITSDYQTVITFQRLIILATFVSSLVLFFVLILILKRAEEVTAQRALEKEKLERELHQSEKLASMGRMVAGVAHEIRNPLGIIRSSAELLLQKARAENSPTTRILEATFEESKRLSRTVEDFLDYARPKQPRADDVDLTGVVNQAALFLEPACRKRGVELIREMPESLHVTGDKDLLYRALYNLLANSMDAMDGHAPGSAQDHDGAQRPRTITVQGSTKDDGVHLRVSDTGPGFDAEALDKVRDPFFTTKDTGTGLGLAIVQTIVQGHGASLTLGNDPATGGARIEIIFPNTGSKTKPGGPLPGAPQGSTPAPGVRS